MMHSDIKQITNTKKQHYRCAFTLIELILVLLIMVIITTVVATNLSGFRQSQQKIDAAQHMLAIMQTARQQAISTGKIFRLNINIEENTYWLTTQADDYAEYEKPKINENKTYVVPSNVTIIWNTPEEIVENKYINFYPDGSTQATCITFVDQEDNKTSLFNYSLTTPFQIGNPEQEAQYQEDEKLFQLQ